MYSNFEPGSNSPSRTSSIIPCIDQGKLYGMLGNPSRLLVFGIEDQGSIDVRWGDKQCTIGYALKPQNKELAYERMAASCTRLSTATSVK
ncbi:FimD/PapC C-terminal domain-containing protein [Burkholderia ubonensis]|uniref:FimD/PapC C-terminal domain-containing protein n=1 Tax=Burkholderia ubonensis TaxID=101571 RepID=UPI000A5D13BD|nr:FimD/PapC C-terminal domain-containing protein [Burkholderia ubonensis]